MFNINYTNYLTLMLKNKISFVLVPAFMAVFAVGFFVGERDNNAYAQEACTVDRALLARIYNAIFHRPLDAGADFHVGRPLDVVLSDIENADEHVNYSALFKAMKALEEARRSPGQLTNDDQLRYRRILDSALSHVDAWADTLPEQAIGNAVVGPDRAREAIRKAYDRMNATARAKAEYGLFNATERIGQPDAIPLPSVRPSNTTGN